MKQTIIHIDIDWNQTTQEVEMTKEEIKDFYETQIQEIESQMPTLRTQRDGLEETIDFWLGAIWDEERLETIKTQLVALATERKELYEKIAELDLQQFNN